MTKRAWSLRARSATQSVLRGQGYELRRVAPAGEIGGDTEPGPLAELPEYWARADAIIARHGAQTSADVAALRAKYEAPVFGMMRVWSLVEMLGQCVDPTDGRLFGASQLAHVLHMLDAMDRDGVSDPDIILVTLVHDLGKVLLLTDEDPANIACMNAPIGPNDPGAGLDNATLQWNHDEFGYSRLVDHVPEHIAWLIRYHSISPECRPLMNERDRDWFERYLEPFAYYDHETKSAFRLPTHRIADYRDLIEDAFPNPIAF